MCRIQLLHVLFAVNVMCVMCLNFMCHVSELLLSQSLSECEDSNYTDSADHISEGFKGTVTSLHYLFTTSLILIKVFINLQLLYCEGLTPSV